MTSFTFSAEQVRSAPSAVRRWMENEIVKALGSPARLEHDPSKMETSALAECTIDELAQIFNLISGNFLVTQVFFELARETPLAHSVPSLHCIDLEDAQRHMQVDDGRLLFECLNVINQALQRVRNDPAASLFASDNQGHVYIHESSYRSIRRLREQLLPAHSFSAAPQLAEASGFVPKGFEGVEPVIQPEYAFGGNRELEPK
jgi:hypothetical protein